MFLPSCLVLFLFALPIILGLKDLAVTKRKAALFENPELFHGDIILGKRNAVVDEDLLWPNGVIPFVIGKSQVPYRRKIYEAMDQFHNNTCISFVPRRHQDDYVFITDGSGCSSMWGRRGGRQNITLASGCHDIGTIVHELNHAVGFNHEQNRSDRDDYIKVLWGNIKPQHITQFMKLRPWDNQLLTAFDYKSVMLYGPLAFSRDHMSPTVKARDPRVVLREVYEKPGLSPNDIVRINLLYGCSDAKFPGPVPTLRPYGIFPPRIRFPDIFKLFDKLQNKMIKDFFKEFDFSQYKKD